jgi:Peptidase family S41/Tricorn protease C1 domain
LKFALYIWFIAALGALKVQTMANAEMKMPRLSTSHDLENSEMSVAFTKSRHTSFIATIMIQLISFIAVASAAPDLDFRTIYPATLEWATQEVRTYTTDSDAKDVWRLSSFKYSFESKFSIEMGPSSVVFGKHGTNVLWAAVLPDESGKLKIAPAGQGEIVHSIWMRFHPASVGDLFPPESVLSQGGEKQVTWGKRLYNFKMMASWQTNGQPMVPPRETLVLDIQTEDGIRRFYMFDNFRGRIQPLYTSDKSKRNFHYEPWYEKHSLPLAYPLDQSDSLLAFDTVWRSFGDKYPLFHLKKEVDWKALNKRYRPQMKKELTNYETALHIAEMLAHLKDFNIWVKAKGEYLPVHSKTLPLNGNWYGTEKSIGIVKRANHGFSLGITKDEIGYINFYQMSAPEMSKAFDNKMNEMADTWAMIIDLRFNGGGNEALAKEIAARFVDRRRVYGKNMYRNGPKHNDLSQQTARMIGPGKSWLYKSPIVVLTGQNTMGAAESLSLMLAQCPQITTMGDHTTGAGANSRTLLLPGEIQVSMPNRLNLLPDGTPIGDNGVMPDIKTDIPLNKFTKDSDPLVEKALELLRKQPEEERKKGRR